MYIGGGLLGTVLVVVLIIWLVRRSEAYSNAQQLRSSFLQNEE